MCGEVIQLSEWRFERLDKIAAGIVERMTIARRKVARGKGGEPLRWEEKNFGGTDGIVAHAAAHADLFFQY